MAAVQERAPAGGRAAASLATPAGLTQFLRLALGHDMYAVRIERVREILEVSHMTPLPLMPGFVRGVMNLRGAVVPVIDLAARLGLRPVQVGRRTCIVMVDVCPPDDVQPMTLGMLVDAVYEVFEAGEAEQEPAPRLGSRVDPASLRSMVRLRGTATPELHLDAILDPHVLADLVAAHAAA